MVSFSSSTKIYLLRKSWIIGLIVGLALLAIPLSFILGSRTTYNIEGIWRNNYYGQCLCGSDNFYDFNDGLIVLYSELHETDYEAGTYQEIGGGQYRIALNKGPDSSFHWDVIPGKKSWIAPPDEGKSWEMKRLRKFYRPRSPAKEKLLIEEAPMRDSKIKSELKKTDFRKLN